MRCLGLVSNNRAGFVSAVFLLIWGSLTRAGALFLAALPRIMRGPMTFSACILSNVTFYFDSVAALFLQADRQTHYFCQSDTKWVEHGLFFVALFPLIEHLLDFVITRSSKALCVSSQRVSVHLSIFPRCVLRPLTQSVRFYLVCRFFCRSTSPD